MIRGTQALSHSFFRRRGFLRAGFLGLSGMSLGDLLRLRAQGRTVGSPASDHACLLVWLGGGPSHLETYDLKPEAPADYRGVYHPIPTCVPGMEVCELLPRHASIADRFSLIRSVSHEFSGHQDGAQHVLTGWPAQLTLGGTITSIYPEVGSVCKRMRPHGPRGMPSYVAIPSALGFVGPAYLGSAYEPFQVRGNPNDPNFHVPDLGVPVDALGRLEQRASLRQAMDRLRRDLDRSGAMQAMDRFDQEAVSLLTSNDAQRAFDLGLVDPRERDRYGRTLAGQSLLLARRLLEAGVGFVSVEVSSFREAGVDGGWDDHATARDIFDAMKRRLPVYDQALSALIEDVYSRGLDKRVLVIVMGEFGRTPRVDVKNGWPGRDHHPAAMSVLVSGGGMAMGKVIGATDSKAVRPKTRPLGPIDILATIYRFLGIDLRHEFKNHAGRPLAILPGGEPIRELVG